MLTNQFCPERIGPYKNFGLAVHINRDGGVIKPRNTAWEQAFLSPYAELRQFIDQICRACGFINPLPEMIYRPNTTGGHVVDRLNLAKVDQLSEKEAESLGVSLALMTWFGMSSLSDADLVVGRAEAGKLIAGPIDLETVLIAPDMLPDEEKNALTTYKTILKDLSDGPVPALVLGAMTAMMTLLYQNRHEFGQMFSRLSHDPIRIALNPSSLYRALLHDDEGQLRSNQGLTSEEKMQLLRGDVPYFFTFLGSEQLFWFNSRESFIPVAAVPQSVHRRLPTWPIWDSAERFNDAVRTASTNVFLHFWSGKVVDSSSNGFSVTNGADQLLIKSGGAFHPL